MSEVFDLFIIGGGINGAGIARDAAGRNLRVCIADKGEFGGATSSWSTKLIHGGLRYLENYEFKLVRESLKEREVIYNIAREITKPIPFIIPYTKNLRPKWLIKIGLFLYDSLGGKTTIPKSSTINLSNKFPNILKKEFNEGFQYYDLQVDDKKLTKLNIKDAIENNAKVLENTKVINIEQSSSYWQIFLENNQVIKSKILINASGPWINEVLKQVIKINSKKAIRLVKGSHIITKKLYKYNKAFTLQNPDNRVVFVIPYKKNFSLIGTTETEVNTADNPEIDEDEIKYLLNTVNNFFIKQISSDDIVDTFSGIRPLIEDYKEASRVTRDYIFDLNTSQDNAPLLNIYGGKLTTYRKLSENVIENLKPYLNSSLLPSWTDSKEL